MNEIAQLILATLEQHEACSLDNPDERAILADVLAGDLLCASWKQFAALTGCEVVHDEANNIVLDTGAFDTASPVLRKTLSPVEITKPLGWTQSDWDAQSAELAAFLNFEKNGENNNK